MSSAWRERLAGRETLTVVAAVTVLALLLRFWALGWRMAHWDEARVAWRIIEYTRTDAWNYRAVVHGPFLFHVNHGLFEAFTPSDFVMRTPVALLGGLLPAAAWLFRERLRDTEVVAVAVLLALNPVLLYYSRFMRNDLLLAAFLLFALGFAVRALDTGRNGYYYAATASLALAVTTKEFVIVDLVAWGCALFLLTDRRLLTARVTHEDWVDRLVSLALRTADGIAGHARALALCVAEFLAIVVLFYAPRPEIWDALTAPTRWPDVVGAATLGSWNEFTSMWVSGSHQDHAYLPYLTDYLDVVAAGALVLVFFAAIGFVVDRYTGERDLVAFCAYWGVLVALVYPLASDISPAPWGVVHAVVPLAIPAGVGVALVFRRGRAAFAAGDRVGVTLAAIILLIAGGQVAATAASTSYVHAQDETPLVQYGQPDDNMKPAFAEIERAIHPDDPDVDVMFYGSHFSNELYRLPLPWYFASMNASMGSTSDLRAMIELNDGPPPVVIARERHEANLTSELDGYRKMGPYAITLEGASVVRVHAYIETDAASDGSAARLADPHPSRDT